ncbi:MAG TPA: C1 family peptidase [Solirubrobacterales bacterium]|nr:C1 family peptidase [Solirubrobacterales bacterium]
MIDLEGAQRPVADQDDRETCTGFAVAASHDWMGGEVELRSAEDVIWAARQIRAGVGDAVSVQAALGGLEANEHASETAWPYGLPHWSAGRPEAALDSANRRAFPHWRRLSGASLELIRNELADGNAVVLTVGVVLGAWQDPGALIDAPPGERVPGNHAVLVVGASEEGEPMEVVKVKNSWGPTWGDRGYALLSRGYVEAYSICAHAIEAC